MLLVIDIGNTNIVFGVFDDSKLVNHWRLSTVIHKTIDEYAISSTASCISKRLS
jgi:type III pantothenate kinase